MKSSILKNCLSIIVIFCIFSGVQLNKGLVDQEKADEVWPEVKSDREFEDSLILLIAP